MELVLGDKERIYDFIKKLNENDRIALISHNDLDGIVSAKVANEIFDADVIKFINYEDMDENLIVELEMEGVNKIIFTDLLIKSKEFILGLQKFAEVLVLDHHFSENDFNSDKCIFIVGEEGYCAAYLCCDILRNAQDIEDLDWLVACASISDFCNLKNSDWLRKVFEKHGEKYLDEFTKLGFDMEEIKKSKFHKIQWDLSLALIYFRETPERVFYALGSGFGNIGDLEIYVDEVQKEIDETMGRFESERRDFPGGYYFEFDPHFRIGSVISTILSIRYPTKTLILVKPSGEGYSVNARRYDKGDSMPDLLRVCMNGFSDSNSGGHIPAAGGYFPKNYLADFRRRLGVKE